jgi:hypothetical protein
MRRTHATGRTWAAAALMVLLVAGPWPAAAPANAAVTYNRDVARMINNVTPGELEPVVDELSGETPAVIGGSPYTILTRSSSSGEPIDMAEQYVYEHLLTYGLDSVAYQHYPGKGVVDPGRNIIGQINGTMKAKEIVVIGAHLDGRPWDGIAPGADDDASGVSAVLYLARAFADETFERTIRFVFFGSEENAPWSGVGSSFGSGYYAARCKAAGENIVAMIEADALAWNDSNNGVGYMDTRTARKDPGGGDHAIVAMWQDAVTTYSITGITPTLNASGVRLSDHGSFWRNGYHAVLFIEDDVGEVNPNWHTVNDTVSTFNWPYYVQMTKSLVAVAAHEAGIL